jgi:hypothetical protein
MFVAMTRREPTQHFLWSMPTRTSRVHLSARWLMHARQSLPSIDDVACACNLFFHSSRVHEYQPPICTCLALPEAGRVPARVACQPPPKPRKRIHSAACIPGGNTRAGYAVMLYFFASAAAFVVRHGSIQSLDDRSRNLMGSASM